MPSTLCPTARRQATFCQPQVLTESIYNLVPHREQRQEKPPRYQSRFNPSVKEFYKSIKKPHETMGYYKTPLDPPNEFLKKHSKEPKLGEKTKSFSYPDKDRRKPPVPSHDEIPIYTPDGMEMNYVRENKRTAIRRPAPKPTKRTVVTKDGDTLVLEYSGLVPKYCTKEEFGQTPKYLIKRQEDMDYSTRMYENFVKEQCAKRAPVKITKEEREEMIKGLRDNWIRLNTSYLGLPLNTDTIRKKDHKEQLEKKLSQLEKELDLLEKHEELYIIKDQQ